jgi:cytidyltransferase-like protein
VFDGVHEGHRALFAQAKKHGDRLIAAVAPDRVVEQLKSSATRYSLAERMELLHKEPLVDEVAEGDAVLGSYGVIGAHRPDVIVLGYDQEKLKEDLTKKKQSMEWNFAIIVAEPHEPERYHNSIMKK